MRRASFLPTMMGVSDIGRRTLEGHGGTTAGELDEDIVRLSCEWRQRRDSFHSKRAAAAPEAHEPTQSEADGCDGGLVAAAAAGSVEGCQRILAAGTISLRARDSDGCTTLCAAAARGRGEVVRLLLRMRADARQANSTFPQSTALHAAAQEDQGKVCMMLLAARADPAAADENGVRPRDFASASEALWPHFAALGCERSSKEDLVAKGVIRRVSPALERELEGLAAGGGEAAAPGRGVLPEFSRPGSAYVASARHPPRPGSAAVPPLALRARAAATGFGAAGAQSARPSSTRSSRPATSRPIDILAEGPEDCIPGPAARVGMAPAGDLRALAL